MEKNQVDSWRQDLKRISGALADRGVMAVLETPRVSFEVKKRVMQEKLTGVSSLAMNLVYFLVSKGRLHILHDIIREYDAKVDALRGIEHAEVTTPFPMDERERLALGETLAGVLGKKKVVLDARVDPVILGGMVARIGDRLIDGSTRTKLDSLKRSLQTGAGIA
ncbi:MAG: ATP synthase F1 subunit delta [Chloroflexi bacterium]|nr:ATP synthase F1 subunit delta [Chloroflexota bacterium]